MTRTACVFLGSLFSILSVFASSASLAAEGIVVENARLRIEFSSKDGSVLALKNQKTSTDYRADGAPGCFPFVLRLKEQGWAAPSATLAGNSEGLTCTHKLRRVDNGQELELTYAFPKQRLSAVVRVRLQDDEDFTSWTMTIDNQSPLQVIEMVFPILAGICIGPKADDDLAVMPAGMRGGYRFARPYQGEHSSHYIGHGNMQWLDVYDDPDRNGACGLYLGAHDKELIACRPTFRGDGKDSVTVSIVKFIGVPPGVSWTSAPFVVAVHEGDWHRGADLYSAWAHSWMKMPRPPAWLKMCDGWDDFGRDLGKDFARWHNERKYGLRFRYPGSPEAEKKFKADLAQERSAGRRISHYFNGQCFDVQCATKGLRRLYPELPADLWIPEWSELGKGTVRTPDGGYVGQYCRGPREQWTIQTAEGIPCGDYIMCPASRQWRDWLKYWIVEKYVKEYGADVIYLDQTAAAGMKNCFDPSHGHAHPGAWASGSTGLVEELVTAARAVNPDFVMAVEGSADCLGQFADIHVISQSAVRKDPSIYPEIFFYTFPEFIIFDGYNNGRADEDGSVVFEKIFIRGHRFDLISRGAYNEAGVALRRAVKAWQYHARFRDTVGVKVSDRAIQAKLFVRNEEKAAGAVLNIWNPGGLKDATVTVSTREFGKVQRVESAALGRALAPFHDYKQDGETVTLPVPAEKLSSYLLIHRGEARE